AMWTTPRTWPASSAARRRPISRTRTTSPSRKRCCRRADCDTTWLSSGMFIMRSINFAVLIIASAVNAHAQGLDSVSPVRARIENGVVTIRQFAFPTAPFPGVMNENPPGVEPGEHRLQFNARDILAFRPEGRPVEATVWQAALAKEISALFVGY